MSKSFFKKREVMDSLKSLGQRIINSPSALIFFDDDPDGLSSFLIIYKLIRDVHPILVKGSSVNCKHYSKYKDSMFKEVFVLDKPMIDPEFFRCVSQPIIWIDHHSIANVNNNIYYFNPRMFDKEFYLPTSMCIFHALRSIKQDSFLEEYCWIALIGAIGDYYFDEELVKKFFKKYFPRQEIPRDIKEALYGENALSYLVKVFSFILKGKRRRVKKNIELLMTIENPLELIDGSNPAARRIIKHYEEINKVFLQKLKYIKSLGRKNEEIVLYIDENDEYGLASILSNYVAFLFPEKLVVIGRKTKNSINLSLRHQGIDVEKLLKISINGLKAVGGGHKHACGASIPLGEFEIFKERIVKNYKNFQY